MAKKKNLAPVSAPAPVASEKRRKAKSKKPENRMTPAPTTKMVDLVAKAVSLGLTIEPRATLAARVAVEEARIAREKKPVLPAEMEVARNRAKSIIATTAVVGLSPAMVGKVARLKGDFKSLIEAATSIALVDEAMGLFMSEIGSIAAAAVAKPKGKAKVKPVVAPKAVVEPVVVTVAPKAVVEPEPEAVVLDAMVVATINGKAVEIGISNYIELLEKAIQDTVSELTSTKEKLAKAESQLTAIKAVVS